MIDKVDHKKEIAAYRAPRGEFQVVEVPDLQYLMVDGHGDPNTSPAFTAAVEALYPVAYTLKFASKRDLGRDYVVMPLEGRWWADDMDAFTTARDKTQWDWTLMIMVPDWIDEAQFRAAVEKVEAKTDGATADGATTDGATTDGAQADGAQADGAQADGATTDGAAGGHSPTRLREVRLESLSEGRCVQTLHVGSFDDEAEVLGRMHHQFIPGNGLRRTGTHHEIYLSDSRRVAPEKMRTILRQPVAASQDPSA